MKHPFGEFTDPKPRPSREEFQRRIDRDLQDPSSTNGILPQPVIYFTDFMERWPILTTTSTLSAITLAIVGGSYVTHTGMFAPKKDSYICASEQLDARTEESLASAALPLVEGLFITNHQDMPRSELPETSALVSSAAHVYSTQSEQTSFATVCLDPTANTIKFRAVS